MSCWLKGIILGISMLVLSVTSYAQEISREQIKGLDEQVQEIKNDVLSIAAELNQLEEKLLYPSSTQVSVFVSLVSGETFRLDTAEIKLDGNDGCAGFPAVLLSGHWPCFTGASSHPPT